MSMEYVAKNNVVLHLRIVIRGFKLFGNNC